MRAIETEIDIAAPAAKVWRLLTDFPAYPAWNPFIKSVEGEAAVGARLRVRIEPPGRSAMTFKPTVVAMEPDRELGWLGRVLLPGLFDGEHFFRLEDRGGGCRFHHAERFSGVLVPLFGDGVFDATTSGFQAMNAALKERAES
jgi:hypothetical protein